MERYIASSERSSDWIATGDVVASVEDRIQFVGREDSVINVGGGKVWPEAVENVLCSVDGVAEAFVYGKDNPLLGSLVMAEIVVSPGKDPIIVVEAARTVCRHRLSRHEVPQRLTHVDRIHVNETGKKVRAK